MNEPQPGERPIVFLDVDGVLNTHDMPLGRFKPECLEQLARIVEETNCEIVVSSSWRYMILNGDMTLRGFEYMLQTHGCDIRGKIIGTIGPDPDDTMDHRGDLIADWLREHRGGRPFVVIDNSDYGLSGFGRRFIQTSDKRGLTAHDADKVIDALSSATARKVEGEGE